MSKAPPRPSMSAARRARLFARDGGVCSLCKRKIQAGEPYEIDHILAWALSFRDDDDNLTPVHKSCHREQKTGGDVSTISKAKRQSGIEGGQAARRAKRGYSLIKGRNEWPKGQKIPARPWPNKGREK